MVCTSYRRVYLATSLRVSLLTFFRKKWCARMYRRFTVDTSALVLHSFLTAYTKVLKTCGHVCIFDTLFLYCLHASTELLLRPRLRQFYFCSSFSIVPARIKEGLYLPSLHPCLHMGVWAFFFSIFFGQPSTLIRQRV